MSVQVRRRREAAAFLSTYVGAGGELLVDTTDNRVQVHDGATPGGWPAAGIGDLPGRNAALNGTFAINQRAVASGAALAANAYGHDRWKAGAGGGTYTFTPAVPDTVVTITAGTLVQAVDAPNVTASAWWLTWTGTAQARVWQGSASGSFSPGTSTNVGGVAVNALPVTGLAVGTVTALEFSTGTLGLVQFEAALPNAGPTRFERRHNELALCQRYYQKLGGLGSTFYKFGFGFANSSTQVIVGLLGIKSNMRATPTISSGGGICVASSAGLTGVSSFTFDQGDTTGASVVANLPSGSSATGFYLLQGYQDGTAYIALTAEL